MKEQKNVPQQWNAFLRCEIFCVQVGRGVFQFDFLNFDSILDRNISQEDWYRELPDWNLTLTQYHPFLCVLLKFCTYESRNCKKEILDYRSNPPKIIKQNHLNCFELHRVVLLKPNNTSRKKTYQGPHFISACFVQTCKTWVQECLPV